MAILSDAELADLRRPEGRGYVVVPPPARYPIEPWAYVTELVGERPEMVERQPIRPVQGGRSIASTNGFAPFHTDSQDHRGLSPWLQILVCRRPGARGGESRLLDGYRLLARLEREHRDLARALRTVPRTHRFYFGELVRPTVMEARGRLVWTHTPQPPHDPIGEALAVEIAKEPVIEIALSAGETLVADNHRMLHGRNAFEGDERDLVRVLAWLPPLARSKVDVVVELLTGVAPGVLARREGISEAELYRWREDALAAARERLGG